MISDVNPSIKCFTELLPLSLILRNLNRGNSAILSVCANN